MVQQRLPAVNSDDGVWGDILRQYLMKEHYNDDTDNAVNGGHQKITVRAGSASAGTAPIKLTSGTLMTTPEVGAIEFLSDKLYFTQTTSTTRKTVAMYDDTSGATGDVYYRDSSGYFKRLGIGSTGDMLTVSSGIPAWSSTIPNTATVTVKDTNFTIQDDGDTTKQVKFQASGITTSTTRTLTVPDANTTIVGTDATQTLTNKTINGGSNTFAAIPASAVDVGSSGTPVIASTSTLSGTTTNTRDVQVPTGVVANDVVLVFIYHNGASSITVTPPAGFTEDTSSPVSTGGITERVYWHRATSTESGTYSFGLSSTVYSSAIAIRATGCITSGNPINVSTSASASSASNPASVSMTTTTANTLLVWQTSDYSGYAITPPSGFTTAVDYGAAGASNRNIVATKAQSSAGATGTQSGTGSSTTDYNTWMGALIPGTTTPLSTVLSDMSSLGATVPGTLPVSSGGTGASTLTGILKGNGTSAVTAVTAPSGTIVGTTDTQTLTNKTLGNTNTITLKDTLFTLQDNGDATKQLQFELSGITTSTTRTLTAPNADTTLVGTDVTQTLTNKTLDNTNTATIKDANFTIQDDGDTTKQAKFQASSITTGTIRTYTLPDASGTLSLTSDLTAKASTSELAWAARNPSSHLVPAGRITYYNKSNTAWASLPTTMDTGQAISYSQSGGGTNGQSTITSGALRMPRGTGGHVSSATYVALDAGSGHTLTRIGVKYNFDPTGASTAGMSVALAMANDTLANAGLTSFRMGAHLSVSYNFWTLSTVSNATGSLVFTTIGSGSLTNPLEGDSTLEYTVEMWRVGNTIVIILPDGQRVSATDSNVGAWSGRYGFYENFMLYQDTDFLPGITEAWYDLDTQYLPGSSGLATRDDLENELSRTSTLTNKTLTTPVLNGTPTGTGVATTGSGNTLALRDSSGNLTAGTFVSNTSSTPTAAGITTLAINSNQVQIFTGSSTQTVKLPTTSVAAGQTYTIINQSTGGAVTVQSSAGNTIATLASNVGAVGVFTAEIATPTAATDWTYNVILKGKGLTANNQLTLAGTDGKSLTLTNSLTVSGNDGTLSFGAASKTLSVNNSLTLAGTDATTMTFPSTTGNVIASATGIGTVSGSPSSSTFLRGDGTWSSAVAQLDANNNFTADVHIPGTTSTAMSGGTVTMDINSTQVQVFTGASSTGHTIKLPTTSVVAGQSYTVINQNTSTGTVAIQSSGANAITTLAPLTTAVLTATQATPTTAAHWVANVTVADKSLTVNNDLTLAGTDGTTMTFPSSSGTVVTLAASQTLTNKTLTLPSVDYFLNASSGGVSFKVDSTGGSDVNYVSVKAAPTGSAAIISSSSGTDTNVDLNLKTQGTGIVKANSVEVATISGTQNLTNKRVTSRVSTTTSSATPTINTDNVDMYGLTAQAVDITSFTTNLSGTPTDGQKLWIYVVGTATRAITWGASFENGAATLPTTTTGTQRLDVGFTWNAATSKWRCMAMVSDSTDAPVTLNGTQTLTNKTLTAPKISSIKDTNGNTILDFSPRASAVNYLQIENSPSGSSAGQIRALGGDANVDMYFWPKASGKVKIYTDSGTTPTLAADGIDSNLDLNLTSKGTGVVKANGSPISTVATQGALQPVRFVVNGAAYTYTISSGTVTQIAGTTIDSVTANVGDRILIIGAPASTGAGTSYTTQPGNGLYVITNATTNLTVARAPEFSGTNSPWGTSVVSREGNWTSWQVFFEGSGAFTWGTTALVAKGWSYVGARNDLLVDLSATQTLTNKTIIPIQDFTNLAAGSNFEGSNHPWTLGTGWSLATDQSHSSSHSLKSTGSASGTTALQGTFPVIEGEKFYLELWARRDATYDGSTGNAKLRIANEADNSWLGEVGFALSDLTSVNTWTKKTLILTIPSGVNSVTFKLNAVQTVGNVWVDDITIRRIPGNLDTIKDTNSNTILDLSPTTSAVNYLQINNGATGTGPQIKATGGDTNVDLNFYSKGSGDINLFDSYGNRMFQADNWGTTTAVNYVSVSNANTGGAPSYAVWGTDTNINLNLVTKGTGSVYMKSSAGEGIFSANTVGSSAVNYVYTQNATTGNSAVVGATGTDTNVDILLAPKGAGKVRGPIAPRVGSTASSSTPTANSDSHDQYEVTALAAGATIGAPTGTPTDGQKLMYRIKDNGTARSLAFNAIFRAVGVTLPTTTVISKTLYIGTVYNAADSKWDVIAVAQEA